MWLTRVTKRSDASTGGDAGFADGPPGSAAFNNPVSAVVLGSYIYVADLGNFAIRRVDFQGNVVTFAGNGLQGTADGLGNQAEFFSPESLSVAPDGTIYVADFGAVRDLDVQRRVTTLLRSRASEVVSLQGDLYVVQTQGGGISRWDGGVLTDLAGFGN